MITSVGSYDNSLLGSSFNSVGSSVMSSKKAEEAKSNVFDNMLNAGSTNSTTTKTVTTDKTASAEGASSDAKKEFDPADLNKDGKVSAQEAIQYMQMQMMDNIMNTTETGAQNNSQSNSQSTSNALGNGLKSMFSNMDYKLQQASNAYTSIQNAVKSVSNLSKSFAA